MSDWDDLAGWWRHELATDPSYEAAVVPLAADLCPPAGDILEVGCGDGHIMRRLSTPDRRFVGVEPNPTLAAAAATVAPVVGDRLPSLASLADGFFDAVLVVLVLEHVAPDRDDELFANLARLLRRAGTLVLVANHPVITAPGAAAVIDPTDGEAFWRWGTYLEPGYTDDPAGDGSVRFHHRPLGTLLTEAASAGLSLQEMRETTWDEPPGPPRLVGLRWSRRN